MLDITTFELSKKKKGGRGALSGRQTGKKEVRGKPECPVETKGGGKKGPGPPRPLTASRNCGETTDSKKKAVGDLFGGKKKEIEKKKNST